MDLYLIIELFWEESFQPRELPENIKLSGCCHHWIPPCLSRHHYTTVNVKQIKRRQEDKSITSVTWHQRLLLSLISIPFGELNLRRWEVNHWYESLQCHRMASENLLCGHPWHLGQTCSTFIISEVNEWRSPSNAQESRVTGGNCGGDTNNNVGQKGQ